VEQQNYFAKLPKVNVTPHLEKKDVSQPKEVAAVGNRDIRKQADNGWKRAARQRTTYFTCAAPQ
jgi:hypothetical protein